VENGDRADVTARGGWPKKLSILADAKSGAAENGCRARQLRSGQLNSSAFDGSTDFNSRFICSFFFFFFFYDGSRNLRARYLQSTHVFAARDLGDRSVLLSGD